jgi:hypothetical protein
MIKWAEGAEVSVSYMGGAWGRAFIRGDQAILTGERMYQDVVAPPADYPIPLDDPEAKVTAWDQQREAANAIDWATGTRVNPEAWEVWRREQR